MVNVEKIKFTLCTGLYFFLSGVEYAVILPTLNGYLLSMNAEKYFLGIVMSSFSFTGLIFSPVFGSITDRIGTAKLCIIAANVCEIVGNFLYFASLNKYMVWGARLISGIGSGAAASVFGVVSRRTTNEERTASFSLLMALRQFGLIIGPGINIFLLKLDVKLGSVFVIDKYTSPGLLMVVLWLLHTFLVVIMYKDNFQQNVSEEIDNGNIISQGKTHGYVDIETRLEKKPPVFNTKSLVHTLSGFLNEGVVVCLAITFVIMFSQTGLETLVTPMTLEFFGWKGFENSLLFCGCGAVVIISFISVSILSKRISDRNLLMIGLYGLLGVYVTLTVFAVAVKQQGLHQDWILPVYCVGVGFLTWFIPYAWVSQASLFSKITNMETQAFNQGIRLLFMGLGQILGPLWATTLSTVPYLPLMFSVDFAIMIIITLMATLSYKVLVHRNSVVPEQISDSDETSPLLSRSQRNTINA